MVRITAHSHVVIFRSKDIDFSSMSIFSGARERNIAHRIAAHNENDHNLIENVMAYRMSASDRTKIKYCDMRHYTSPV